MTTNPFYNALFALAYIVLLVSALFYGSNLTHTLDNTVFVPIMVLSTLVLSVALMGFLFFYQPVTLILEGKREQAVRLFLQTIGIFACGVALLIATGWLVGALA